MNERVKLIQTLDPDRMPLGMIGTVITGNINERGMLRILWDNGQNIPMLRAEIEVV